MTWIKFTNVNKRREERITITKSGAIGFPSQFYSDNSIKSFRFVVLYFDPDQHMIALQFSNDENEKDKISIIHSKSGDGGYIQARNFFKTNKINPIVYAARYEYEKENNSIIGEVLIIKLKENAEQDKSNV